MNKSLEDLVQDTETLIAKLIRSWQAMPIPSDAELTGLLHEYGEAFYSIFAGKAVFEVDREALNQGSALLFMSPKAALTYVGAYMIALLELLPSRRQGEFVFDQLLSAHLFGTLTDLSNLQDLTDAGLSKEQAELIAEFLTLCASNHEILNLDILDRRSLDAAKAWLLNRFNAHGESSHPA